jgi:hypothetical protein
VQQLSGTLSGRIRAGLVVDIMPETSTSKYFVQKSLEEKFLRKEKLILGFKVLPGKKSQISNPRCIMPAKKSLTQLVV